MKKLFENLPFHAEKILNICAAVTMLWCIFADISNVFAFVCIICTTICTFSVSAYMSFSSETSEIKNIRDFLGEELDKIDAHGVTNILLFAVCMYTAVLAATYVYNPDDLKEGSEYNAGLLAEQVVILLFGITSFLGYVFGQRLAKEQQKKGEV